jgi:uncharacterized protein YjiS (DUF1127 family)
MEKTMSILKKLKSAAAKRADYHRTVAELSRMDINTALDLDIYHGDIPAIARRAVYGA